MATEQIIFILIALALSIFSLYKKSKRQKQHQTESEEEENLPIFLKKDDSFIEAEPVFFYQQNDVNMQEKLNIYSKQGKKKQKTQNIGKRDFPKINPEITLQEIDLEKETETSDLFEGTDLQKAFLFGEIFKNVRN
ncbi:MAG: hypothetical protein LBI45_02790 [Bacteroidales bacterium]|jgi:hypothetical protein|nr:hypothetical protein [Bacteroidales bacterium]